MPTHKVRFQPVGIEIEVNEDETTHYGRQVRLDDRVLLFANPEDAAEYLGFTESETAPA